MKTVVATVGGSEEPIIVSARKLGLDRAILLAGLPAGEVFKTHAENEINPISVAEAISSKLKGIGAQVKIIKINPFDFEECCMKTIQVIEEERLKGSEIFVVVSGGTKIQSLAASYAAYICGCRVFYVQQSADDSKLVEIPLTISEFDDLSKARRDVLRVLEDGDDAGRIAEKLRISRKTASQYLKELKEYGLVESVSGKVRRYRLTFAGKICRARWGV